MSRPALRLLTFPGQPQSTRDAEIERAIDQLVFLKRTKPHGLAFLAKLIEDVATDAGWKAAGRRSRPARAAAVPPLELLRQRSPRCADVIDGMIDDMLDELTKDRA
jgi:hypothetical protein